jgi:hypothetical protein
MKMKTQLCLTITVVSCLALLGQHRAGAQGALGARALGMGGAFTALAEGDTAAYWNPAAAAGFRGTRLLAPNLGFLFNGPATFQQTVSGFGSNWQNRLELARQWSHGATSFGASAYTGIGLNGGALSFSAFGKGELMPTDFDGTPGKLTLTPDFTVSALRDATVKEYTAMGFSPANAGRDADKIVQQIQKTFPGATNLTLPAYNSRVMGKADVYGTGFATVAHRASRTLSVGLNIKLVGAERIRGQASFSGTTLTDKLAQATGGTASPALVDRVLHDLNLTKADGTFFAGRELAGDATWQTSSGGMELRPSLDAGALWRTDRRTQVGLVVRNLIPAHFTSAAPLNTYCDFGVAHTLPKQHLLLAADLTNLLDSSAARINVGVEWQASRWLAFRTGIYQGHPTYGVGIGRLFSIASVAGMSQLAFSFGY